MRISLSFKNKHYADNFHNIRIEIHKQTHREMNRRQIARVWVDNHAVYAETTDGLQASYEFDLWPRLLQADDKQRQNFELSYFGILWPELDEDLVFESMFHAAGLCEITVGEDSVCYC